MEKCALGILGNYGATRPSGLFRQDQPEDTRGRVNVRPLATFVSHP